MLPEPSDSAAKRIFISYSHDSDEHKDKVLSLSKRLRLDGLDTALDQYINGTPLQDWPRWMLDKLDEATHVLVICTEAYYRRFRGHEALNVGKGVDWEGALITQELYDAKSKTCKFVPVLFADNQEGFIPEPLRGKTRYILNSEQNYQALYDFLLGQAGVSLAHWVPLKKSSGVRLSRFHFQILKIVRCKGAKINLVHRQILDLG